MGPRVHYRGDCSACGAALVFLAGDPSVGYEDIEPSDGGARTLVEHTDQRCGFHRFLTPDPARHVLPGNADWLTGAPSAGEPPARSRLRYERWSRTDPH
jgi:hypothetical protein